MPESAARRLLDPDSAAALAEELKRYVEIESSTDDPAGLARMASAFEVDLAGLGFTIGEDEGGVLFGEFAGHVGGPRVLLVGHIDTVYPPDSSFRGLEARDIDATPMLVGPGAVDMKGGLIVCLAALRALGEIGRLGPCTVLVNRDEEQGSVASAPTIRRRAAGHDVALVFEPGFDVAGGASTIVVERAGLARVRVAVRGVESHSGNQPTRGLSAVATAARMVDAIDALADVPNDRLVRVCTFRGGDAINQVPGHASLGIDVRFADVAAWDDVLERIRTIAASTEDVNAETGDRTAADVEVLSWKPPMPRMAAVEPYLAHVLAAADSLGQRLAPGRRNGTSDGNHVAEAGVPVIDGLGVVGVGMHVAGGEAVRRTSIAERAALVAASLGRIWDGAASESAPSD